jgi:hypothetical protein
MPIGSPFNRIKVLACWHFQGKALTLSSESSFFQIQVEFATRLGALRKHKKTPPKMAGSLCF